MNELTRGNHVLDLGILISEDINNNGYNSEVISKALRYLGFAMGNAPTFHNLLVLKNVFFIDTI